MFYIIDHGARTQTPIASILGDDRIKAIQASNPIAAIGHDQHIRDLKPNTNTNTTAGQPSEQHYEATEQAGEEPTRHPASRCDDIMTRPVFTLSINDTVADAWRAFNDNHYHHIPLVNETQQLEAIISDRDLLRFAAVHQGLTDAGGYLLADAATRRVITAMPQTSIRNVAEVMMLHRFGSMPVVNDEVELVGIVTRSDILKAVVTTAPLELWV